MTWCGQSTDFCDFLCLHFNFIILETGTGWALDSKFKLNKKDVNILIFYDLFYKYVVFKCFVRKTGDFT